VWTGLNWLRIGFIGHGNEHSCSIKSGEFFDWMSDSQLSKNNSALWSLTYLVRQGYRD